MDARKYLVALKETISIQSRVDAINYSRLKGNRPLTETDVLESYIVENGLLKTLALIDLEISRYDRELEKESRNQKVTYDDKSFDGLRREN